MCQNRAGTPVIAQQFIALDWPEFEMKSVKRTTELQNQERVATGRPTQRSVVS